MFVADGGKSVEGLLAPTKEPYRPEMQQYEDAKELGTLDMWKLHLERSELQRQYLEQWMSHDGLDAILGTFLFCNHINGSNLLQPLQRRMLAYHMEVSNM